MRTLAVRFEEKVDRTSTPDGCHLWTASGNRNGENWYGKIGAAPGAPSRMLWAHRVALELALGRPIRKGFQALHACNNPPCCRVGPGHIYEGTMLQNMADMVRSGRSRPPKPQLGADNKQAKVHAHVVEIRARAALGERHASIARRFGISQTTVQRIVLGRHYRYVPMAPSV